jgi:hypothetical protein
MSAGVTLVDAITVLVAEKRAVGHKYDAEARVTRHHAEPRDQSPSGVMRSVRSSPPHLPAATARRYA